MPFIAFMTWRANTWDLTKRSAFIIAILLCGDVMVFPKAIQSGRVSWWLISIIILLITGASWPSVIKVRQQKNSQTNDYAETKNKVEIIEQIKVNPINYLDQRDATTEPEIVTDGISDKLLGLDLSETIDEEKNSLKLEKTDEVILLEASEALETITMTDGNEVPVVNEEAVEAVNEEAVNEKGVIENVVNNKEEPILSALDGPSDLLSMNELLELGFNEKNSENFAEAATYFMRALTLEPKPDIAFYLILDCYWLWKNIGESEFALSQIMIFAKKYSPLFSSDLQHQFEVWLIKEDLDKYFKK